MQVSKEEINFEIDSLTHKRVEVAAAQAAKRTQDAMASDMYETLDAVIIHRLTDFRDSVLRGRLRRYLRSEEATGPITATPSSGTTYDYVFVLPAYFKDGKLGVVAQKIHQYIVNGALLDWYHQIGAGYDQAQESRVQSLEDEIYHLLFTGTVAKRPLQPFGPGESVPAEDVGS